MSQETPYVKFLELYEAALEAEQRGVEAIAISSFDNTAQEVESRFVNLKYIQGNQWIFFSNYLSPKALNFESHPQISALFHWGSSNTQIRIKANIKKSPIEFSDKHFQGRSMEKNALAISSQQSALTNSYQDVKNNFSSTLEEMTDSTNRPEYWGGFSFKPYYFEFWQGHQNRLNQRHVFNQSNGAWVESFLQP